jgi:hypothetical protein
MNYEQFSRETGLSIEDAGRLIARLRADERPANATVWRWCKRGLQVKWVVPADGLAPAPPAGQKVLLEHWRVGGRIMTTEQAVRRFLEATQDRVAPPKAPAVTSVSDVAKSMDSVGVASARERIDSFMKATPRTRRGRIQRPGKNPPHSGRRAS